MTVESKLCDEEIRRKKYPDEREEKVLKVGASSKWVKNHQRQGREREPSNTSNHQTIFCYFCKKRNHIMRDCLKFQNYCEENRGKEKENFIDNEEDDEILTINEKQLLKMDLTDSTDWTLDSGATSHISNNRSLFAELRPITNKKVKIANGSKIDILGIGTCRIRLMNERGKWTTCLLTDVLFAPDLTGNFISIRKLNMRDIQVNFLNERADIIKAGTILGSAMIKNDLFKIEQLCAINEVNRKACIHEFHRLFGHKNFASIKKMIKEKLVTGIELKACASNCESVVCSLY